MDYGMEILNKNRLNQRCDYVSFDDIIDVNILKNNFDNIHNNLLDIMGTTEDWQKYLICRTYPDDQKFEDVNDQRFTISLNDDTWDDFSYVTSVLTELFGSMFGIHEIQVFWDASGQNDEIPKPSVGAHIDEDNFIWLKFNENRTLCILKRDETEPYGYTPQVGDKFSYFSPIGFFHDPPKRGNGIAMRISLRSVWFSHENESEKCKKLIDHIKSFSYKSKIATGDKKHKRLPFIDYSECVSNEGIQAFFGTWNGFYFYEAATDKSIILSEVKK